MVISVRNDPAQLKKLLDAAEMGNGLLRVIANRLATSNGPKGTADDPIHVELHFNLEALESAVNRVADELSVINTPPAQQLKFKGGGFMFTFKGDRPDEVVKFTKPKVVDSEGTPVDSQPELSYTFTSNDEELVSFTSDPVDNGDTIDLPIHYGKPVKQDDNSYAIAELTAESNEVDTPSGPIRDVKKELIQLVPGDAAGFSDSGFKFSE